VVDLIESWNGNTWVSTPAPTGPSTYELRQMSCVRSVCVAVGSPTSGTVSSSQPVVVTEDNGVWGYVGSPDVPSAPGSLLSSVSCVPGACIAVGETDKKTAAVSQPFVMMTPPPSPTISAFTPTKGPVGTVVTIKGTALLDASAVTFKGVAGTVTKDTASTIKVEAPSGIAKGRIEVITPGGSVTSVTNFKVTRSP
jgi:hypothetical protein